MTRAAPAVTVTASPRPPDSWLELLDRSDGFGFHHEELWNRALCDALPGVEARWIVVRAGEAPAAGQVMLRSTRRGFHSFSAHHLGHPCPPVTSAGLDPVVRADVLDALVATAASDARAPRSLGLDWTLEGDRERDLAALLERHGFRRRTVETAVFPLAGGIDHVAAKVFKLNRRNERNRSLKAGCTVDVSTDPEDLAAVYRLYTLATRRWGTTPLPESLLCELLLDGVGRVFLVVVRYEGAVVGGHLCWQDGDTVVAWVGATDPDHSDKYVPTLIVWGELCEACRRGASWLDLGGDGGQPGVRKFKKLLGAGFIERGCWKTASTTVRLLRATRDRLRRRSGA